MLFGQKTKNVITFGDTIKGNYALFLITFKTNMSVNNRLLVMSRRPGKSEKPAIVCKMDKLGRLQVFKIDTKTKKMKRVPKEEGFRCANINKCPNTTPRSFIDCQKVISKDSYPCKKKRTVFSTRREFLEFVDLKKKRRSPKRTPRKQKVKKANIALKKQKTPKAQRTRVVRFAI